ncbi:hypothetical protein PGTUg99_005392 [Puccinia graminis f. sp. tritici]|uniref:Uncharacterized protein n=1 Tax=Puccinia graminis f. sp. tritici TaxID=56615 RepID=A0A5B0LZR2_PUCGR|nr:hypothetical protein PGTUg99_005392 [Puccinia graminis f. sp. tritici]
MQSCTITKYYCRIQPDPTFQGFPLGFFLDIAPNFSQREGKVHLSPHPRRIFLFTEPCFSIYSVVQLFIFYSLLSMFLKCIPHILWVDKVSQIL